MGALLLGGELVQGGCGWDQQGRALCRCRGPYLPLLPFLLPELLQLLLQMHPHVCGSEV